MSLLNGHKVVIGWATAIGTAIAVLSWVGGVYVGWSNRVEAAVVEQRMVNAHDETLKAIVPKVEACHDVNERQNWDIGQNEKDIASLTAAVGELRGLVDRYLQEQMREGRIPR